RDVRCLARRPGTRPARAGVRSPDRADDVARDAIDLAAAAAGGVRRHARRPGARSRRSFLHGIELGSDPARWMRGWESQARPLETWARNDAVPSQARRDGVVGT